MLNKCLDKFEKLRMKTNEASRAEAGEDRKKSVWGNGSGQNH